MFSKPEFSGRRDRRVIRDRIVDDVTGFDSSVEAVVETKVSFDGVVETVEERLGQLMVCNHVRYPNRPVVRCEECSEKANRPVLVCDACSFCCPITGVTLCLRCGVLGPDRKRYSTRGLEQAQKMGYFAPPRS